MIPATRRLELWVLTALPGLLTVILAIFCLSAKHIGGLSHVMPALPMIPIFYWGMMHAREMPYWFVFALGLVTDAVTGLPLGPSSLLNVFFLGLLHAQRKYIHKEGFLIKWGHFAVLLAAVDVLSWLLLSLFFSQTLNAGPVFIQWLLTICCYPALHKGFDGINDRMHARRWQILH